MLSRIPDRVKVGWKNYDVVLTEPRLNSGAELYGQIDHDAQVITLRGTSTHDQLCATLLHEVLHAVSDMYGLGLEEKLVEDLTNALYTVYKDNVKSEENGIVGEMKAIDGSPEDFNIKSRYSDDPHGGIEWLFHGNPKCEDKKVKVRIDSTSHPKNIYGFNGDEAILFVLNDFAHPHRDVMVYSSVDVDGVTIDAIEKMVKEKIFHLT
jgi:hypothetical protein